MIRYGELDQAIAVYTCSGVPERIPVEYYRRVIKAAIKRSNAGKQWDLQQSAAILLYFAFNDGHLHPSQLTASGLKALDYAEKLVQETATDSNQSDAGSDYSIQLLKGA